MMRTKVASPSMSDNIYCILEFAGVPVRIFSVNFGQKQYNWALLAPSGEGRSKDELRIWPLIEKPIMPKKLDRKLTLIPVVQVVRLPFPQAQAPARPIT